MMRAEDVISICQSLAANRIQVWLTGGWGIDALLQEQTRPHKDLDITILVDDVLRLRHLLARAGLGLKELLGLIEDYRQGLVPLIVSLTLLKHHLNRHPVPDWVHQQVYLHPYPKELMLRNHVDLR